ncbi:MAG: D-2-hydroxyacid dehydrogenase [Myxococcales bacterium]|nr:D-2-hydroxyacid dehydrogenase [Myxococcales bacterium]MCB9754558.1 D-2-hydroxyacid dehydrogenase [Myxococcales bacterium]
MPRRRARPRLRRSLALAATLLLCCGVTPTLVERAAAEKPGPKIVVAWLDDAQLAELRAAAPKARVVPVDNAAQAMAEIADADALLGLVNPELLRAGAQLDWVQVYSAGVDRYQFPELTERDIVLTNAKVIQGPNVADQAMALLLALTRGIHRAVELKAQRDWRGAREQLKQAKPGPIELDGKTALVVGLGGIGSAIAARAHGFGMKIIAVDPTVDKPRAGYIEAIVPPSELRSMLPRTDVLFLAVPLTPETEGMIGAEEFAALKPGAYLVNIARGKVVDTDAMVAALRGGSLAGAGLDVTEPEPLPPDHPLWTLENVVLTPHMGGTSDVVWERRMELLRENVRRYVAGEPLRNVVDKQRGY